MASLVEPGFAIRRKSCPKGLEVDCGATGTEGFHACCPSGYTCPGPQYNVVCCLPGADGCTEESLTAAPKPACANATWDMFDNGGFFCCEHGFLGYNKSNMNGCASPKDPIGGAIQFLSTVRVGVDPATIVSSTSVPMTTTPSASQLASPVSNGALSLTSASVGATSPTSPPSQQDSSSTPVGAIAGGVVGGIAALALVVFLTWFFMRRRQQPKTTELPANSLLAQQGFEDTKYRSEVDGQNVYELNEHGSKYPAVELNAAQNPVELDGTDRAR